ncbi:TP53-regulated inhibitor of apoptosis 1 [Gouania willdenowi]|uniref:Uncharacterized protein n=1 Tax=Gouania willdenowi TaxID=441366 RepID=A0A8C5DSY7_GOUWI|nr:TP53-regulated inhibitor of apoptosis 1 [Gouania willdenowi]
MNSVGETCTELKREYDQCFNRWFAEHFLKGDRSEDPLPLTALSRTSACVQKAIRDKDILWTESTLMEPNKERPS